jgi:hypothetical protein
MMYKMWMRSSRIVRASIAANSANQPMKRLQPKRIDRIEGLEG